MQGHHTHTRLNRKRHLLLVSTAQALKLTIVVCMHAQPCFLSGFLALFPLNMHDQIINGLSKVFFVVSCFRMCGAAKARTS
jgi:hypothetical protein